MKMILKKIYSLDIDEPLSTYLPNEPNNFFLSVKLLVGDDYGSDAADLFDMNICTPKWLLENCSGNLFPRGFLIMESYNLNILLDCINELLSEIEADNWEVWAEKLNKFAIWEFDNYRIKEQDS